VGETAKLIESPEEGKDFSQSNSEDEAEPCHYKIAGENRLTCYCGRSERLLLGILGRLGTYE
jgi:hypothetical protein